MNEIAKRYAELDRFNEARVLGEDAIRADCLIAFPYAHPETAAEIAIETDEFTAVCPWTGQPDYGTVRLRYLPREKLLELKSFKYYLLSYRSVGIVQEHVAARMLADLVRILEPERLALTLDYKERGGIHTVVTVSHPEGAR